jgi:hypothetical protein
VHGRPIAAGEFVPGDVQRATCNVALFWSSQLIAVAESVAGVLKPRVVVTEQ